jgi:6-phosphogluconolactonase
VRKFLLALLLAGVSAQAAGYLVFAGTYTRQGSKGIYAFRFETSNGKLTSLGVAAETPNPSFLIEHPNHRFLYAVNEGSAGTVSAFAIDSNTGKLTALNQVSSKGKGPCHLAIDKTGRWIVVSNYDDGTVTLLSVAADGKLGETAFSEKHPGSSANPSRQRGPHAHEALFTADNRYVLVADLGLDKIFVYRFDAEKGAMTANDPASASVTAGAGVRHLVLHPNGRVLYTINELNSTVSVYNFDPAKGSLNETVEFSSLMV